MSDKRYLTAQALLEDSLALGAQILKSGFRPDFIVGVWRGGTPVGIAVQELLEHYGVHADHIAIRTSSYRGMQRDESAAVRVHGLDYVVDSVDAEDALLIIDDVFDTGLSVQAIIERLHKKARRNAPQAIRIATAYFKPERNRTQIRPDYFVHETDDWLVFPHEMSGLSDDEIRENKPYLHRIMQELAKRTP
ncbi:MAG TPA: hypoxanthine phosphoribosyltransferase [Gammaproteobacteria bacterium]|jgi:hypoxanthine phosphoribosyltransferase|nr:hypoxanthine phosphoribosyltransferase [Gammaproteobacteria bacterium]